METYFIIAIGGTGMRCLESFVYLCTIGMFDNKEFNILMLDTDINNGNFERVRTLIDQYNTVKGAENAAPSQNTFLSAKLNKFVFSPRYDQQHSTFELIANLNNRRNKDVANLFFDRPSQRFNLQHGYRAQTHMGSYLIYHSILDAVKKYHSGSDNLGLEIYAFMNAINNAGPNGRIFIMGSVFGGTGASSLPIMPRAIDASIKIINPAGQLDRNVLFGAVLITHYFTFNPATAAQLGRNLVIADAVKFALNSQAALMFYEEDSTIRNTYKVLYHVGWPLNLLNFDKDRPGGETTTGGREQKNPGHILELMAATAADDFFKSDREVLQRKTMDFMYKTAEYDDVNQFFTFPFIDFYPDQTDLFKNNLTAFYLLNYVLKDLGWDINNLINIVNRDNNTHHYNNIPATTLNSFNEIIKSFGFSVSNNQLESGWLWQLKESTSAKTLFYHSRSYASGIKDMSSFNYGEILPEHKFTNLLFPNPYDQFRRSFTRNIAQSKKVQGTAMEQFTAHLYNTLTDLLKIIKN